MEKYINPFTDYGFKKIFGDTENTELLRSLINDILGLEGKDKIETIIFKNGELLPDSPEDRKAIFDLYCEGESGEKFIVELQKVKQNFFKDRSIYYSSFPIQEQAKKGNWDFKLEPVYTVGILDFVFDDHKNEAEYFHMVELKNQNGEVFYDKLKFIYIELPKFKKQKKS